MEEKKQKGGMSGVKMLGLACLAVGGFMLYDSKRKENKTKGTNSTSINTSTTDTTTNPAQVEIDKINKRLKDLEGRIKTKNTDLTGIRDQMATLNKRIENINGGLDTMNKDIPMAINNLNTMELQRKDIAFEFVDISVIRKKYDQEEAVIKKELKEVQRQNKASLIEAESLLNHIMRSIENERHRNKNNRHDRHDRDNRYDRDDIGL